MFERAKVLNELGLPIVHGFTDRKGGVSDGRYATLNMAAKWGDRPEAVAENLSRVAAEAGFRPESLRTVRQVHGHEVLRASDLDEDSAADALWAHRDDGQIVIGVLTADCVPVLLADRRGEVICAVHSGWRGTVAEIVPRAVALLARADVDPATLVAAIGPCIEVDAFEVGEEVASQFPARFVRPGPRGRPHVDLVGTVRAQLESAGVRANAIERVGACTYQNAERWFSYRRDGKGIGQMLSFIGFVSR